MSFVLKKLVSAVLQPTAVLFVLLLLGAVYSFKSSRNKRARICLYLALVVSALSAFEGVPNLLLGRLEQQYPAYDICRADAEWMLVLGHGFSAAPGLPHSSRIDSTMHARLAEALRIARQMEHVTVLVSLAGPDSVAAKEQWMEAWCQSVDFSGDRVRLITEAVDTHGEMVEALNCIKHEPFILVTSASHMPRAVRMAERMGGAPVPAPCDHKVLPPRNRYSRLLPSVRNVAKLEEALHEYLGMTWYGVVGLGDSGNADK